MFAKIIVTKKNILSEKAFRLAASLLLLAVFSLIAAAQGETKVDQTFDDCDQANALKVQGKTIKKGESLRVELPALTNEVIWFCDGDPNRSASDKFFNVVKITRRTSTDEFKVEFFKKTSSAETQNGGESDADLVTVGTTKDDCNNPQQVRLNGKNGVVKIKPGESKLVELSIPQNEIKWFCETPSGGCPSGKCDESSGNPVPFNFVRLERAGNGALNWIFYLSKKNPADNGSESPDFVRNATGTVIIKVSAGQFGSPEVPQFPEGILKTKFDDFYRAEQSENRALIEDELQKKGEEAAQKFGATFRRDSLTLAAAGNATELRTAVAGKTLLVKYLAHGNKAKITFIMPDPLPDPQFEITFDVATEITIPLNSLSNPKATKAVAILGHAEIEGSNAAGNIVQEVFKSKLQNVKSNANNFTRDILEKVNGFLATDFPKPPAGVPINLLQTNLSLTKAGTVRLCLKTPGADDCKFTGAKETVHQNRVLDASIDRCEAGKIWLRDAEKERFVSIGKGQKNVLVEIDSRAFSWFCGGSAGPEALEKAAGPLGTYLLSVTRDVSGDSIEWKFLAWK